MAWNALVPVDFSAHSREAAKHALRLARDAGGSVEFLYVISDDFPLAGGAGLVATGPGPRTDESARKGLDDFVAGLEPDTVPVRCRVERGFPAEVILKRAGDAHPDLVIMGTHGRTGLARVVLGSQTEQVVRQCPSPVLVVRARLDG